MIASCLSDNVLGDNIGVGSSPGPVPVLVGVSRRVLNVDGLSYELWFTDNKDGKDVCGVGVDSCPNDGELSRIHRSTILVPKGDSKRKDGKNKENDKMEKKDEVLCISSAHFLSPGCFMREVGTSVVRMNEFVDGISMNLFWDSRCGKWLLSTKKNVGGGGWFVRTEYSSFLGSDEEKGYGYVYAPQHTFLEMFEDAVGGEKAFEALTRDCVPGWTYSFVVRHPATPHLTAPDVAVAYLVSVQRPDAENPLYRPAVSSEDLLWELVGAHPHIRVPKTLSYLSCGEIHPFTPDQLGLGPIGEGAKGVEKETVEGVEKDENLNYVLSVVDRQLSMVRFSAAREKARERFGNDPNLMYRCLRLFLASANEDDGMNATEADLFQAAFPWLRKMYTWTEYICTLYVALLYRSYVRHFIKKTGELFTPGLFYHMRQLHQQFLDAKRSGVRFHMTNEKVFRYLCSLNVSTLYAAVTEPILKGGKAEAFLNEYLYDDYDTYE